MASSWIVASCTPRDRSVTSSREGQRVAAMRRRRSAISSPGTSTRKGRTAVSVLAACVVGAGVDTGTLVRIWAGLSVPAALVLNVALRSGLARPSVAGSVPWDADAVAQGTGQGGKQTQRGGHPAPVARNSGRWASANPAAAGQTNRSTAFAWLRRPMKPGCGDRTCNVLAARTPDIVAWPFNLDFRYGLNCEGRMARSASDATDPVETVSAVLAGLRHARAG
jgi:hypothetical protein